MPKTSPPTGRAIHYNTQAPVHPSTERINGIGNRVHDEMIRQMTPTAIADTFAPMAQACQVSGLLRDCWRSKFRFRKRPNPEQSVRLLFRVLQGSHQNIVPPANPKPRARVGQSQHLVDTASHLSTFFNDFAEKFWNVDEELGGRILPQIKDVVGNIIAVLTQVTTRDTRDLGSAKWEAVQELILRYLSNSLEDRCSHRSHQTDIKGRERLMNVNNLITAVRLHFTEYEYVQRIESDFGIDIDSLADAILNQFMTGLNAPVSPVRNVDMATWTSHVHEEFRVLNAIRDGGVFSSLDAAVAAFFTPEENAGYPEEHRKFHNLAVIARTPFYVVRAIGFNAFIDLMDMAVRISPIFSVPDIDVHRRTRVSTRHSCVRTHLSRHCVRCLKPLESMSITVGIAVIKAVLIRGSQLLVRPVPRAELRGWASRLNE